MSSIGFYVSVTALVLGLISIVTVIWTSATKIARLELKVDTMWAFQMRRAFTEATDKGVATLNSPLTFTLDARDRLKPIEPELKEFWKTTGSKLKNDADILLEIEAQFGQRLIEKVCIPCSLTHGACLLLAYAVATGRTQVNFPELVLDPAHDAGHMDDPKGDWDAVANCE